MQKKSFISLLLCSMISLACHAQHNIYLKVDTGFASHSGHEADRNHSDFVAGAKVKHKNTNFFSGAIGYSVSNDLRFDLNVTYLPEWNFKETRKHTDSSISYFQGSISSLVTTVNGYYDFTVPNFILKPYVTAGIGYSVNKISNIDAYLDNEFAFKAYNNNNSNLAWKAGAGFTYEYNERIFFDLGYRYTNLGRVKTKYARSMSDNNLDSDVIIKFKKLHSHQALLGIGFKL